MADSVWHYREGERLLAAAPANEDEQEEWARVRGENIAAAMAHFTAAEVALEAESRIGGTHRQEVLNEKWRKVLGGP